MLYAGFAVVLMVPLAMLVASLGSTAFKLSRGKIETQVPETVVRRQAKPVKRTASVPVTAPAPAISAPIVYDEVHLDLDAAPAAAPAPVMAAAAVASPDVAGLTPTPPIQLLAGKVKMPPARQPAVTAPLGGPHRSPRAARPATSGANALSPEYEAEQETARVIEFPDRFGVRSFG